MNRLFCYFYAFTLRYSCAKFWWQLLARVILDAFSNVDFSVPKSWTKNECSPSPLTSYSSDFSSPFFFLVLRISYRRTHIVQLKYFYSIWKQRMFIFFFKTLHCSFLLSGGCAEGGHISVTIAFCVFFLLLNLFLSFFFYQQKEDTFQVIVPPASLFVFFSLLIFFPFPFLFSLILSKRRTHCGCKMHQHPCLCFFLYFNRFSSLHFSHSQQKEDTLQVLAAPPSLLAAFLFEH